ncbi:hypothetical protein KXX69_006647, partial [Aspergillus fumigatus]
MSARGVPQVREPKKEFSIFVGVEGISPRSLKSESGGYLQPPSRANDIRTGASGQWPRILPPTRGPLPVGPVLVYRD